MYNRYIPQPDGTYRRSRIPDQQKKHYTPKEPEPKQDLTECAALPPPQPAEHRMNSRPNTSVMDFLRQLMPKEFDTGDLLIVLLLLLMSGDCAEDQNTALLTLVLYLFL